MRTPRLATRSLIKTPFVTIVATISRASGAVVFGFVALLAGAVPAWRAARVDLIGALSHG